VGMVKGGHVTALEVRLCVHEVDVVKLGLHISY